MNARGIFAVVLRWLKRYLFFTAASLHILLFWLILGLPIGVDRWLIRQEQPMKADAIVCLAGGLDAHRLPTAEGWRRIYTAVQLLADGWAPCVVFSGGGTETWTEAEAYAEAARWLDCPKESIVIDPHSAGTSEHAKNILNLDRPVLSLGSALLLVTSPLHSQRAYLCFKKAGLTNFRTVTNYVSRRLEADVVREKRRSSVPDFTPSGKSYDDPINRLRWRFDYLATACRELAAIVWYKIKGYV